MKKINVSWGGTPDSTGYLLSFAKSLSTMVRYSPWAECSEDIIATSGFAFRMWVHADLCPSSTSTWNVDMQKSWVENGGLVCEYVGRYWGEESIEKQKLIEAIRIIKKSIDNGVPAMAWDIGIPAWGLITGYDDDALKFSTLGVTTGEGEMLYDMLGKREIPFLSVLTVTGISEKTKVDILRDTMKQAAAHLKGEELSENSRGLDAYPTLMKHFEVELFNEEKAWNRQYLLGTFGALKYYAWKYFEKNGQTQLGDLYKSIHIAWVEAFMMNSSGVSIDDNYPNVADAIRMKLKSALESETRALEIMTETE